MERLQKVIAESGLTSRRKAEELIKDGRVKVNDEKLFFEIIKENFTKRRKTINNSISSTVGKEKLKEILKELNISENTRGENLTIEDFAKIANLVK